MTGRDEEIDGYVIVKFGTLDSSENTIDVLGDGCWPQTAEEKQDETSNTLVRDMEGTH